MQLCNQLLTRVISPYICTLKTHICTWYLARHVIILDIRYYISWQWRIIWEVNDFEKRKIRKLTQERPIALSIKYLYMLFIQHPMRQCICTHHLNRKSTCAQSWWAPLQISHSAEYPSWSDQQPGSPRSHNQSCGDERKDSASYIRR